MSINKNKMISKWNYPTSIYHGPDSLSLTKEILLSNKLLKPLIITDDNLIKANFIQDLLFDLKSVNINFNIFHDLKTDPDYEIVYKALNTIKLNTNDSIIIIGGGSALDLGKAVALLANSKYDLWQFEDGSPNYIDIDNKLILPTIAVPTTAGTGSEVGRVSVIIDNNYNNTEIVRKRFIFHKGLTPNWVILDPVVTKELPANLTAATGLDALTHALEAYFVDSYHPLADGIAIESIKIIKDNILLAYNNPEDITARGNMLTASTMAATAFQKGLGAVHALAHPLGAIYKLHHGLLNAIILPYVIKFNYDAISDKINYLEKTLSLDNNIIDWLMDLRTKLQIPNSLNILGIDISNNKELIISEALADPSACTNPIRLNEDNLRIILDYCYLG